MCCREPRNWDTIRRAAHIVHSCSVAEFNANRISAVFAAYTNFEVFACLTAALYPHLYQLSYAILIDSLERVFPWHS